MSLDGRVYWGQLFDTSSFDRVWGLAALPDGGVAVGHGVFVDHQGKFPFKNSGGEDAIVTKWSALGELVWLRTFDWPGNDSLIGLVADSEGNAYAMGTRWTSPSTVAEDTAKSPCHGWVAKLGPGGDVLWLEQLGDPKGHTRMREIALTPSGHLVLVGSHRKPIRLGSVELNRAEGGTFMVGLDPSGNIEWATTTQSILCMAVDTEGRILVVNGSGVQTQTPSGEHSRILPFPEKVDFWVHRCTPGQPG